MPLYVKKFGADVHIFMQNPNDLYAVILVDFSCSARAINLFN